ncbi:MAG: sugar phosphate isomerase/epimerase [Clostridia bacterium]|nr:sugar phosphate isomerase/epimerase [Clostridia bacterium]
MKIGAMVESFRLDFEGGIKAAASLGVDGVQAYATNGELAYDQMTADKIKWALDVVKSNGLVFSAICGDFGVGFGRGEAEDAETVEKSKRVMDLAKKLECNVVTTHIGTVPREECALKEQMRRACRELALYADSIGSAFAVETGPEMAEILCDFLDSLGAGGVRVNFDPANLVMVAGDRPETAVKTLGRYIVHTHAKDGIKLGAPRAFDPGITVGKEAVDHEQLMGMGRTYLELPLGEGDVNFDLYLPALSSTGFDGFLTIEREVGKDPVADISLAVNFLKEKKEKFGI